MSSSSISDSTLSDEPLPNNDVVVMEDNKTTKDTIKKILEKEFNLEVKVVNSKQEAIDFAENNQLQYYILDVNMGNHRRQEGIDALEVIKTINDESFVSILTGHPTLEIKKMASILGADLYIEKSFHLENDIRKIALQIKKHHRALLQKQLQTIDRLREDIINKFKTINKLEKLFLLQEQLQKIDRLKENIIDKLEKINKLEKLYNSPSTSLLQKDINITAYEKWKLDEKWYAEYMGKYVAFREGQLIDSDEDEQRLLEQLKADKHQDKPIFLTKVEENKRIVDLPSSLWFDYF